MKAIAVFPKTKEVKLIDHPEPALQKSTDVKIRMLNVGICGTDRDIWRGDYGEPPQGSEYLINGHESFGEVAEIGSAVRSIKVGDYVVPTVRRECPENCPACANGQQDFCYTGHFKERGIKQLHGYMAEFVVDDEKYMNIMPRELKDVGVLLEPLTITEKAMIEIDRIQARLPWKKTPNALVLGAGPVGILAAMVLRRRNINVHVVARHPAPNDKATLVQEIGGKYFSTQEQNPAQIADQLGGIDLVIEATGAAQAAFDFLPVLGTNGIFVFTGVPPMKQITLDGGALMRDIVLQNQVVLGTVNAPKQAFQNGIQSLLAFQKQWPRALRSLITERVPIDDYRTAVSGEFRDEIKMILVIHDDRPQIAAVNAQAAVQ